MKGLRVRDDRGHVLVLPGPPARIVSLVPSDTYSLVRLGARDRLVGRTRYCVAPAGEVEDIEIVGGTKDAGVERIVELAPDLVVANQEENSRRDIERLEAKGVPVLVSFPRRVAAGLAHLARLALALGLDPTRPLSGGWEAEGWEETARALVAGAYHAQKAAEVAVLSRPRVRAFVPIWMDPLMTVHGDTFISDVLALAGAENVFAERRRRYPLAADLGDAAPLPAERVGDRDVRYPRVTLEEVAERAPEIILLPDEPHPFTEADAAVFRALDVPAARCGQVVLCDGKDLMWYGARSVEGLGRLRALVDAARAASGPDR
jgi:ABC-type Fe3+-hydroxamate transport system substrate-binding protein